MPAAGVHLALEVDVDVVPARELALHPAVDRGVGMLDAAERLIGENDAESESVVGCVALPHGDLVPGSSCLASAEKYRPPGPPPITAMRIALSSGGSAVRWMLPAYADIMTAVNRTLYYCRLLDAFSEPEPLHLAGRGLRQLGQELDPSRILVRRDRLLDEVLQLGAPRVVAGHTPDASTTNAVTTWPRASSGVPTTRALDDGLVGHQCLFHLRAAML